MAAGDALGAGYEFGPPLPADTPVSMTGGGTFGWAPGEWTDDTSMAIPIAQAVAEGKDLRDEQTQDQIVRAWYDWSRTAADVGVQTRTVLNAVGSSGGAREALAASEAVHRRTGRSAGNGSLMRTAPVALAYLDDEAGLIEAARAMSKLTHWDDEAAEACIIWCLMIRTAVLDGEIDPGAGLAGLPDEATREKWSDRFDMATEADPATFDKNGWVVQALQGAWASFTTAPTRNGDVKERTFPCDHLVFALENAVRGGRDTDTVAAITGALAGAWWGASAVPARWRRVLHGWPGMRAKDLIALAMRMIGRAPASDAEPSYPINGSRVRMVAHPDDPGVLIGDIGALRSHPDEVDAVVSLCRVAVNDEPDVAPEDWVQVRLVDRPEAGENLNLDFVLYDAVRAVAELRDEGKIVLLHCVQAQSRTPAVAAMYGADLRSAPTQESLKRVIDALPDAAPQQFLRDAIADAECFLARIDGFPRFWNATGE